MTGQDSKGKVLWGFVATRMMLEQPHGSIAIYDRLREILNDSLAGLGLPDDRPEDVVASAEAEVAELERLVTRLRQTLKVLPGNTPSEAQLEKARDVYRAAHDVLKWVSHETSIGRPPQDNSTSLGNSGNAGDG